MLPWTERCKARTHTYAPLTQKKKHKMHLIHVKINTRTTHHGTVRAATHVQSKCVWGERGRRKGDSRAWWCGIRQSPLPFYTLLLSEILKVRWFKGGMIHSPPSLSHPLSHCHLSSLSLSLSNATLTFSRTGRYTGSRVEAYQCVRDHLPIPSIYVTLLPVLHRREHCIFLPQVLRYRWTLTMCRLFR